MQKVVAVEVKESSSSKYSSVSSKKGNGGASVLVHVLNVVVAILSIIVGYVVYRLKSHSGDPLTYLIPNFLILTPLYKWGAPAFDYFVKYDGIEKEPQPIPEIMASEYTNEKLRILSNDFSDPVVIRGMYADSPSLKKWTTPGYLKSKLGHHIVPTRMEGVYNEENGVAGRRLLPFGESIDEILADPNSKRYLFFPFKSPHKEGNETVLVEEDETLNNDVTNLVREDFDLNRIFPGFGGKDHKVFKGAQILVGNGFPQQTTGTYWHTAMVNNYFIQVAGVKHWFFLDQKHSALLKPRRDGLGSLALGNQDDIIPNQKYMPVQYCDLEPGDVLYNPEWEWHAIKNDPGLTMGIPIREVRFGRIWNNNHQYLAYTLINAFLAKKFGYSFGVWDQ